MKIHIFLLIIFLLSFNSSVSALIFPNDIKWKQIESEHFTVVYHINDIIAFKTINIAESIHQELYKKFRIPDNIYTYIVIVDSSDIANGIATALPANIIVLYYTGIEFYSEFSLLNTYNWWKELILHEYIHILHLNQRNDINRCCSFFGLKYFILNPLLPAFCIEGTAVCFETEYTRMGRARSYYTEMVLRTSVYENNLPGLDDIAFWNVRKLLPGEGPYIWGGAFNRYILNKYGEDRLLYFYYTHSGCINCCMGYTKSSCLSAITLSPLNGIGKSVFGQELYDLWDEWILALKLKYKRKIKELNIRGITKIKRISDFYYEIYDVALRKKTIYFSAYSPNEGHNIYKLENNKITTIVRNRFANSLALLNQTVYFTGYEYYKNYYNFLELFKIDLTGPVQITQRGRLKSIFEYENNSLIAVRNTTNNNQIIICNKNGDTIKIIAGFRKEESIGDIVYISGTQDIYFILKKEEDFVDIYRINLDTKEIERITENPAIEYSLFADKSGLYFVSDFDGIYNLYYYSFEKKEFYKLSNFVTGILRVIKNREKFYVVAYSSYGYYIGEILKSRLKQEPVKYNNDRSFSNYIENDRIELKSFHSSIPQPYSPFKSMLSTVLYAPAIIVDTCNDRISGGISLYVSDILFYHLFLLNFFYDNYYKEIYFDIDYYSYSFEPNLNIWAYKYHHLDGGSLLLNFFKLKWQYYFSLYSGINIEREFYKYFYNSFVLKITYNSTQYYPLSVNYERGIYTGIMFNIYDRLLGSEENLHIMRLWGKKFIPVIFSHHTLSLDSEAGFLLNQSKYKPFEITGPILLYSFPPYRKYRLKSYIGLSISGKNYIAGTISYTFPIIWIEQGYRLLPFMLEKFWTKMYYELAQVFDRLPEIRKFYDVAGLEFHTTIKMFYRISSDIGLGISKPLKRIKGYTYYITINLGF